ncbi:MAG: M2 family metallopeptidase [Bacteroidales bacterium]|nr:M2 family metallopeptidase [Bacteroidales bacterium]
MNKYLLFILLTAILTGCKTHTEKMEKELVTFIDALEEQVIPIEKAFNLASFNASVSGSPADYKKAGELHIELSGIYSDNTRFAVLKRIKESGKVKDPLLIRQMELLYNTFLSNQLEEEMLEEMIRAQTELEEKFSTYRAVVNDAHYTDNELENVLKYSTDNAELEKIWLASKQIGDTVAGNVIKLVKMRNEAARGLGFENFHDMSLRLTDQDPAEIEQLFDELDNLTRDAFTDLKDQVDSVLSSRYGVAKEELMPWHYQNRFFQEAPALYDVNLDHYYETKNVADLAQNYYAGIGLDVSSILARSDLYEKENKYQHAYCTNIDRSGDVRIIANIKNNASWMNTILHELGHGVYDLYVDATLPYFLRTYAHSFTTEAIAMFFGRLASNPYWILENADISEEETEKISADVRNSMRLEQLVFSRWSQVMFRFEKSMYGNPDQDLNQLWWDLVTKYQLLKKPEGRDNADWASKIHIASYPCYYHNYLLGELLASQLTAFIETNILTTADNRKISFSGNPDIGSYLEQHIFNLGASHPWKEMIRLATGEELTAKYYAEDFLNTE